MQLKALRDLLLEIGLPGAEAEKQLGLLIILINKKIQSLQPNEARLVINKLLRGYLDSVLGEMTLSKKLYFEEKIHSLVSK